jgi:hypothetical protein
MTPPRTDTAPSIRHWSAQDDTGLDQERLFRAGLDHVQRLSSRIWTDYNVHDPGITILELLAYALTDLAYRASLPVEDLLARDGPAGGDLQDLFPVAERILPNRALTQDDYRKLLIDHEHVRNAWVKPAVLSYYADPVAGTLHRDKPKLPGICEVPVRGLYEVLVEFEDEAAPGAVRTRTVDELWSRLEANRNLCEDFVRLTTVEQQRFIVCGELELAPGADAVCVTADVLFRIQQYLAPPVRNYSLDEMLERRKPDGTTYTVQELFDGPRLAAGFIDDGELRAADLRTEIRLSDVISIIMGIDGVLAVADAVVNELVIDAAARERPKAPDDKWFLNVSHGKQPCLAPERCRLVLRKRGIPVVANHVAVSERLGELERAERAWEQRPAPVIPVPGGRYRQLGRYYSFQNHFPVIYGLGPDGLNTAALSKADAERRKVLALQLKAYLLLFDQLMANYCAQLEHVNDLFSSVARPVNEAPRTYFAQRVNSFRDADLVYSVAFRDAAITGAAIASLLEDSAHAVARRNRFLDHLIARFAERFHDYANVAHSVLGSSPASLIPLKCAFLQHYPEVGAARGLGYDLSRPGGADPWDSDNVSGLERRVALLIGIAGTSRRNLSDVVLDDHATVDATADGFMFRILDRSSGEILLSSSSVKFDTAVEAESALRRTIHFGQLPGGYDRKTSDGGSFSFNIVDDSGKFLARHPVQFDRRPGEANDPEVDRDRAIDALIATLRERFPEEGLFVIENILLRPSSDGPFLPICVDPNCADCEDKDPYSYRVHIVLPAYAGRFTNMEFRRFVEEVIREETPAHILPKVCWISRERMRTVETTYREWLELPRNANAATRAQALAALIGILETIKNVYPASRLEECEEGVAQPQPFRLGRTVLGSIKS